jgi:hypothetical protein
MFDRDAITLTAEILEFSAVTQGPAQGTVLEARLELNLVKIGTLFINFINCHNNGRFGTFCMFDRLNCLWHNTV